MSPDEDLIRANSFIFIIISKMDSIGDIQALWRNKSSTNIFLGEKKENICQFHASFYPPHHHHNLWTGPPPETPVRVK